MGQSRPTRWAAAWVKIRQAHEELADLQSEYSEWLAELESHIDNAQLADRLQQIIDIDIEVIVEFIDNCEMLELPPDSRRHPL